MNNSRNSTLEILRIISMVMVIGLHYMNKTIGGGFNTELKVNIVSSHILESICITSVNIFVLISGYFMQSAKTTGFRKAVDLYLVMLFYNLSCFGIATATGQYQFSVRELVLAFFPFFTGLYWFLETYIILLLIAPFINRLLNCLNKKSHEFLIFIQIMLFSIWPSFFPNAPIIDGGYGIINFITLYFISSYIRKYSSFQNTKKTQFISLTVFAVSCFAITVSSFLPYFSQRAWAYCYIFNILASTALFVFFLYLPKTNLKIVNTIAGTTFGVYITHSMLYFQPLIYHSILHTERYYNSEYQTLHFLISIILLFAACAIIDFCRQRIWNVTVKKILDKSRLIRMENDWENRIIN